MCPVRRGLAHDPARGGDREMRCVACDGTEISERPERTASLAWPGRAKSQSEGRNEAIARGDSGNCVNGSLDRAESGSISEQPRNICLRAIGYNHQLCKARRCKKPISASITESTVQSLLHRRMNAQQQMRWSPRGVHLMLKVRCAVPSTAITPSPKPQFIIRYCHVNRVWQSGLRPARLAA
jgi:hypothetical protein